MKIAKKKTKFPLPHPPQKNPQNMKSVLHWTSTLGHGACPGAWLIYLPSYAQREKTDFPLSTTVSTATSLLVGGRTWHLPPLLTLRFCLFEPVQVLCALSPSLEFIWLSVLLCLNNPASLEPPTTSGSYSLSPSSPHRSWSVGARGLMKTSRLGLNVLKSSLTLLIVISYRNPLMRVEWCIDLWV